jgi:DMSO/TMAO reductase YedYZ molybdopterin-dependent catalytic subunit
MEQASPTTSARAAFFAGVIGAALALSIGELAAAFNDNITSLVTAIGEFVIDITPGDLIAESINTIGTLQKPLLLGGITIVALLIGGWLGLRGRTQLSTVPVGFMLFGLVGALAASRSQLTSTGLAWLIALIAAAGGAVLTLLLLGVAKRPAQETDSDPVTGAVIVPGSPLSQAADRRRFITFGGAAVGTAAVWGASRIGGTSAAERAREQIISQSATSTTVAPGETAVAAEATTSTVATPAGNFDFIEGLTTRITPISPDDEFYLIDTALSKPQVDPDDWLFSITGNVDNPISYTYEQLMARDLVEREVTLSCVSNPVGGNLVGNAIWRGIPLSELFEEAGIQDPMSMEQQVFMTSVDGFTCGFPTPLAYDGRTAMLALEMNGEPLPIIHGFPARVVVAGLYGYVSATKWIENISITDWDGVDGFWIPRGWSKEGPVKTQSRIDVPRNGARVDAGPVTMGGIAWSPTIGIDRVELSFDQGQSWQEAELANTENDEAWVQWRYDWDATPGEYLVGVRATDKSGFTQSPNPVAPAPNGAEGYHVSRVQVS